MIFLSQGKFFESFGQNSENIFSTISIGYIDLNYHYVFITLEAVIMSVVKY